MNKWTWFFLSFRGRISKKPYWVYMAILIAGVFLVYALSIYIESQGYEFIAGGILLLMVWPTVAVNMKRWHDRGRSGWWFILAPFIPIIALWILVESAFFPSDSESNRFGPSPNSMLRPTGEVDRFHVGLLITFICVVILFFSFPRFQIPSGAMMPTLLVGDFIIVSRIAYGVPMPFTYRELVSLNEPDRGDVVVFLYPKDPSTMYIKRIVGIPGDHIGYYDKVLYINGRPAEQIPVGVYQGVGSGVSMSGTSERLEDFGTAQHSILVMQDTTGLEGEYVVPEDGYFVMGDNRDNSNDSRFWGAVPKENIIGKASRIWMNWDSAVGGTDWGRIGMKVH
jgi:signal peptidase I